MTLELMTGLHRFPRLRAEPLLAHEVSGDCRRCRRPGQSALSRVQVERVSAESRSRTVGRREGVTVGSGFSSVDVYAVVATLVNQDAPRRRELGTQCQTRTAQLSPMRED